MRSSVAVAMITWALTPMLLVPRIAAAADPLSLEAPVYKAGDTWIYDRTHKHGKEGFTQERVVETIEHVDANQMVLGVKPDGSPNDFEDHLVGLDLSERRVVNGQPTVTERLLSFPMKIGSTWEEDFEDPRRQGVQTSAHVKKAYKVIGWEDVVVPAGTFHALKIEANGSLAAQVALPAVATSAALASPTDGTAISHVQRARSGIVTQLTYRVLYYVPAIKSYVKTIYEQYDSENIRVKRDVSELVSFKAGS